MRISFLIAALALPFCAFAQAAPELPTVALVGAAQAPDANHGGTTAHDLNVMAHDQTVAKTAYLKRPNAANKRRYVVATVRYGTACMTADVLDRKVKYRKALHLYREALKVDPTNAEAKNNAAMIESIYRMMHRPIPN